MTEQYKPSPGEAREAFAAGLGILPPFYDPAHERVLVHRRELFMRMIEAVKAEAWSEGFQAGRNADHNAMWWPKNPYRKEQDRG